VKGVLLDALPYPDSQRLVSVYTRFLPSTGLDFPYCALSGPEVTDLNEQVRALSVSTYTFNRWNAAADGSDAERVRGIAATANLFTVLDTPAAFGRAFVESDGVPGAACVTVLSDGFWRDRFAGAANVLGRTLRLDGRPCTVIGVMPPRFMFPDEQTRLWTAMALDPASPNWGRGNHYFAAVAFVLLIVCANLAGLMLSRRGGVARSRSDPRAARVASDSCDNSSPSIC
jgi:putative ABC transport system permease protein